MSDLTDAVARIAADVTAQKTVDSSILALVSGFAQQLRDLVASNTANATNLNSLADAIEGETGALQNAVTANTPAQGTGADTTGGTTGGDTGGTTGGTTGGDTGGTTGGTTGGDGTTTDPNADPNATS